MEWLLSSFVVAAHLGLLLSVFFVYVHVSSDSSLAPSVSALLGSFKYRRDARVSMASAVKTSSHLAVKTSVDVFGNSTTSSSSVTSSSGSGTAGNNSTSMAAKATKVNVVASASAFASVGTDPMSSEEDDPLNFPRQQLVTAEVQCE